MPISLTDHFDQETIDAAKSLVRGRRVTELKWSGEGRMTAKVDTGIGALFVQSILFRDISPGFPKGMIEGKCTCSGTGNCVHVAAALLESLRPSRSKRPAARQVGAAPKPNSWMSKIQAVKRTVEELPGLSDPPQGSDSGSEIREVLLYVLALEEVTFRIDPYRGAIYQGDQLPIRSARRFDVLEALRGPAEIPSFVDAVDMDLLSRLATRHLLKGQTPINTDLPALLKRTGEMDIGLIRDLCSTGRFLLEPNSGSPLTWSEDIREAHVGWVETVTERSRLGFFSAPNEPIFPFRMEGQGFWIDAGSAEIGVLRSTPTREFLRVVQESPDLSERERAEVDGLFHARDWGVPLSDEHPKGVSFRPAVSRVARLTLSGARAHKGRYQQFDRPLLILPALRLSFDYEGVEVRPFDRVKPTLVADGVRTHLERDQDWEASCVRLLLDQGAVPVYEIRNHVLHEAAQRQDFIFAEGEFPPGGRGASGQEAALEFAFRILPQLEAQGWVVSRTDSWPFREERAESRLIVETLKANGDEFAGHGWFDLGFSVRIGEERFNLVPLITAFVDQVLRDQKIEDLLNGPRLREILEEKPVYVNLGSGRYGSVDLSPISDAVQLFLKQNFRSEKLHPAESKYAAEVAEALSGSTVDFSDHAGILPLGRNLMALNRSGTPEPPKGVNATLRPYQGFGSAWMGSLVEAGFGGLLADDMGLGKTLQVLTLLQARREAGVAKGPALLVVPTSLLHGWQEQAARFTPDLRLVTLHGSTRSTRYGKVSDADLVMTTYQLLSNDRPFLRRRKWDLVVVDEAQTLKNPDSQMSRSLREVPAMGRLALSGTPMQNTLQDLWSLFDWLNPGLLGDRKTFQDLFRNPIEKRGDMEAQSRLNRRVAPFLLRRTKDAVAADLPPKTEILDEVILDPAQQALYESVRSTMDKRVREAISARGLAASQITILDALLRLRQVCCDPALVKTDEALGVRRSAKRERLIELLQELIAEGRRVLVFSQFVEMLDLIKGDLDALGIDHLVLTGKTQNRAKVLDAFRDGSAPVFLISLKAGGVGLNLTEADTVILYDPWWNPAVESQAMDRAHRIGQDKPVFVHRLVAAGTVEERILEMQARKQALADALLKEGADEAGANLMDEEVLADLFAPLRR